MKTDSVPERSVAYTWGSTAEERAGVFPCDRFLADADACFRAVNVEAPAPIVFRWLCQLKVAPYRYDWIDNFGRRSPRALIPGLEELRVGQRFMTLFELVDFEPDRHVTCRAATTLFGAIAVSYTAKPRTADTSRLVVKLLARYPRGPARWVLRGLLPWGDLVMMRKQLLNLKALAERQANG